MIKIKEKLSGGILRDIDTQRAGSVRIVIHKAHSGCKYHLEKRGFTIEEELPLIYAYVVSVPRRAIPLLAGKSFVKYIEHDAVVHIRIDKAQETVLSAAYKRATMLSGKNITIACIDTGCAGHPDFTVPKNRIKVFVDMISGIEKPYDDNGHGTFCMGCAGGSGALSGGLYEGVAAAADLVMIKALDGQGNATISVILKAMQWVSDNASKYGIRVLSMSLGVEPGDFDPNHDTLAMAAEALWRQGIVVVAAAGNSGPKTGTINSPGTAGSVITVGAANDRSGISNLDIAPFSSRSAEGGKKPDILAPGVNIVSTASNYNVTGYTTMSGTSMAAPIVAGCVALMLEREPALTPDGVKRKIMQDALSINLPLNVQGRGVIQVEA